MSIKASAPPQAPFTSGTGYLLSQLGRLAERSWGTAISAVELTQSEYVVLAVLLESPGLSQRVLAGRTGQDPRNAVATVARLTERGFVRARTDTHDRRRKQLSVTPAGRRRMDRLSRSLVGSRADFLAPLDDEEREVLRRLLLRVHRHHVEA